MNPHKFHRLKVGILDRTHFYGMRFRRWPLPIKDVLTTETMISPGADSLNLGAQGKDSTFANVFRSKGSAWIETQHRVLAEWSHAGRHFRLNPGGVWWATLPAPAMRAALSSTGEDTTEETEAYRAELASFEGEFGDRRQELVFIGTGLDVDSIKRALDDCLLSDVEMDEYRAIWSIDEQRLSEAKGPFRFKVGEQVECCLGESEWYRGIVVAHYYREAQWPLDRWMPYQVRLDDSSLIWAPADVDACIRRPRS